MAQVARMELKGPSPAQALAMVSPSLGTATAEATDVAQV